jgi:hypothetical protein
MQLEFGFLTALTIRKISEADSAGRSMWRLQTDLAYMSEIYGLIVVEAGFETDLASVPRIPFVYWMTGGTADASAVIHDYLVSKLYPQGRISWSTAADVFAEAMKHEGVPAWRRALMHWAVAGADPASQWRDES